MDSLFLADLIGVSRGTVWSPSIFLDKSIRNCPCTAAGNSDSIAGTTLSFRRAPSSSLITKLPTLRIHLTKPCLGKFCVDPRLLSFRRYLCPTRHWGRSRNDSSSHGPAFLLGRDSLDLCRFILEIPDFPQLVAFLTDTEADLYYDLSDRFSPLIHFPLADSRAQTRPAVFSSRITNHRNGPRGHHDSRSPFLNRGGPSKVPKINFFPQGVN